MTTRQVEANLYEAEPEKIDTSLFQTRNLGEMLNGISSPRHTVIVIALLIAGCVNDTLIKANQQRLEQQQIQLDQLKQDVAALQAQRPANNYTPLPPGACDQGIMRAATRKGGEKFAVSDFSGALNYYQDALAACPSSAQANLNLARTYEALGDRAQALAHYRTAAAANGPDTNSEAIGAARAALSRLGG